MACEVCQRDLDGFTPLTEYFTVTVVNYNELSGRSNRCVWFICRDHLPSGVSVPLDPLRVVRSRTRREVTGGLVWSEGEYPYSRDIPPEEFPDWLTAVAEMVEETIRSPPSGLNGTQGDTP